MKKDEISKKELDKFWNVKVWPLGITKWKYTLGFLLMGIISFGLLTIILCLWILSL